MIRGRHQWHEDWTALQATLSWFVFTQKDRHTTWEHGELPASIRVNGHRQSWLRMMLWSWKEQAKSCLDNRDPSRTERGFCSLPNSSPILWAAWIHRTTTTWHRLRSVLERSPFSSSDAIRLPSTLCQAASISPGIRLCHYSPELWSTTPSADRRWVHVRWRFMRLSIFKPLSEV